MVSFSQEHFGLSQRRSCKVVGIPRSTARYIPSTNDDHIVISKIHKILEKNKRYGCEMVHLKLRQSGILINHKRTERIYRQEGLQLLKRSRRKKIASTSRLKPVTNPSPGEVWSIDFMADAIKSKRLKILTVIDPATNESPVLWANYSITGNDVVDVLSHTSEVYGKPKRIYCDNGPEFIGKIFDQWCFDNKIQVHLSRPGKPVDNCHIESFNSRLRYECLNTNYFLSLRGARKKLEDWRVEYNTKRPQKRFRGLTPEQAKTNWMTAEN